MVAHGGWDTEAWERRQWWRKLVTMIVFLALCVAGLLGWSRSLSGTVFAVFCIVFAGLGVLGLVLRRPGVVHGRPVAGRIDDGTGPVDAVRFGSPRALSWCLTGALFLMAVVMCAALASWARANDVPVAHAFIVGPGAVFAYVFAVLGLVMVWVARMTRFVAVTPDALVLAFRGSRVRVPWDDIVDARPVREQGLTPAGHTVQRKMTRSIALLPAPTAVAAPAFARVIRRFGGVRFLSREIGAVPMIDVDQLAAPPALLRAVRWHLSRPHTLDTLIEGHATDWHGDLTRTEGR